MNDHSETENGWAVVGNVLDGSLDRCFFQSLDRVHDGISNTMRSRYS